MINTKIVGVEFEDYNKVYLYKSYIDVNVGDIVVVETRDTYSIATVVSVGGDSNKATKYVVSKLDIKTHEEKKEKVEKQNRILEELDKRVLEINKLEMYERFAEYDNTVKNLLETVKCLSI